MRRKPTDEAADLAKWGCSYADYAALRSMRGPTRAYQQHRRNAHSRGIAWEFNIWQWWTIWQASGHWGERGCGQDHYVMCRKGDVGPYAPDNVYIALSTHNNSVRALKKSGLPTGVDKKNNRYRAKRMIAGKLYRLGYFLTVEQAEEAYRAAAPPSLQAPPHSNPNQQHAHRDQRSSAGAREISFSHEVGL